MKKFAALSPNEGSDVKLRRVEDDGIRKRRPDVKVKGIRRNAQGLLSRQSGLRNTGSEVFHKKEKKKIKKKKKKTEGRKSAGGREKEGQGITTPGEAVHERKNVEVNR